MKSRHKYTTLNLYISKEYIFAFAVAFIFFFAIFFVNQLLVIAKNILLANVSILDVLKIILYSVPVILSFTFPFASLTGAAMAVGQLSSSNELLALRAGGISFSRIFFPVIAISLVLTISSFALNDILQPLGTIKYKELYRELLYRNPALELRANSVSKFGNTFFIAGNVDEGTVDSLFILKPETTGLTVISSESAELTESAKGSDLLTITLKNIEGLTPKGKVLKEFDHYTAEEMEYSIFLNTVNFSFMSVTPNDMSIRDLFSEIKILKDEKRLSELQASYFASKMKYLTFSEYFTEFSRTPDSNFENSFQYFERYKAAKNEKIESRKLQYYLLEFYKKTALPTACTALVFFAFPLSAFRMRNGKVVGFGVGIIASTFYWFMLFAGQTLGNRVPVPPFVILWFPNVLYAGIGIVLLYIRGRR
jgi:lipopolysaccharide export system permease protein